MSTLFYPELCEIKPKCKANHFDLIISNPCFELWLYYGYFDKTPDNNGFIKPPIKKISSNFKTYLNQKLTEIGEGGADPRKAIFKINEAISNAKLNFNKDRKGIPKVYSTNMFQLAEKLLPLIETELKHIAEELKKRAEAFKKGN